MKIKIEKGRAEGKISAPASKSVAHRFLIAAAMANGRSRISGITPSEDVLATIDCLRALGAVIEYDGAVATVFGVDFTKASPTGILNSRESGSTLRFLIPLSLLSGSEVTLMGAPRLIERPHGIYEDLCRERGLTFIRDKSSITVKGPLGGGDFYLPGNVSSQFITGLLFALPNLPCDSKIILTTALESRSYINLTLSCLAKFGVRAEWIDEKTLLVTGNQLYRGGEFVVEGDYSGAAFIDALSIIGGGVEVDGLLTDSLQADRVYKELFPLLKGGTPTINIEDCPDLGPILFALASALSGAVFVGTRRLKIKESDRAEAMAKELSKFGARLSVGENDVTVHPQPLQEPTETLFGHNDHRIVMSLAVIATLYGGIIEGAEAVAKSYPDFFSDLKKLGINCYEI